MNFSARDLVWLVVIISAAPPTAPLTPTDQGPVARPEMLNSDGAEFKLGDR